MGKGSKVTALDGLQKWFIALKVRPDMELALPGDKGIIVARIRARQSATSLFGAQAKAGV